MRVNYITIFDEFIDTVLADTEQKIFPKTITALVKRVACDLQFHDKYYFDEDEVQKVLTIMSAFPMTKGKYSTNTFGECVLDWQVFFIACIYGFKHKSDDTRRYRNAMLLISRKNGKSALANNADQARIVFQTCQTMLARMSLKSPAIKSVIDVRRYQILKKKDNEAVLKYLASNSSTLDGLGASTVIFDEVHEYKNDDMVNVMRSGSGHRSQPLMCFVTTAGFVLEGLLHNYYKVGKDILYDYAEDDTFFPMIWEIDADDDYNNPDCWFKANPASRAGIVSLDWLKAEYQTAKNNGNLNGFRTKNLNQFVAGADVWIHDKEWNQCAWKVDDATLKGSRCFAGIDLSSTNDLTSIALYFPDHKVFKHYNLFPEDNRNTYGKRNYSVYTNMNNAGELIFTNGNVIDYDAVVQIIADISKEYNLERIAVDKWQASQLMITLGELGYDVHPFAQNFGTMGAAFKELTKCFMNKEVSHMGSPMLNWQRGNVVLEQNHMGLTKPTKSKSSNKIDTIVSITMALGNYLDWSHDQVGTRSRYEDDDTGVAWF
jgi:phage terminase large subunit-like protein